MRRLQISRALCLALAAMTMLATGAAADQDWWAQPYSGSALDERPKGERWVGRVKWDDGYIEVVARGAADPALARNRSHAEVLALKTARYRAYEKLLEIVNGVRLDAYTRLKKELLADGGLDARVRGMVRGARIIDQKLFNSSDGSVVAEVRLGLHLAGPSGLTAAALAAARKKAAHRPQAKRFKPQAEPTIKPAPAKKPEPAVKKPAPVKPAAEGITGLVIVAEKLGARPAMFPRILESSSGREVYGPDLVDRGEAMQSGVVGYATSVQKARANPRVGASPMVVKAIRAEGMNKANLVVSYQDAVRIFAADVRGDFLRRCRVVVVIR